MPSKLSSCEFIDRANEIHNNKYDYSCVKYTSSTKKVNILCPKHGEFKQTPNAHLNGKNGCKLCYNENRVMTEQKFISQATEVHGNRYDYSFLNFINSQTPVNIGCYLHGEFTQFPYNHVRGMGCKTCAGNEKSSTEQFILKAKQVHGNTYDYSQVIYVTAKKKVTISCCSHGTFLQTPNNHLKGQGCRKCADALRRGGYSMEYFNKNPSKRDEQGTLYVVKLSNATETFYKIGITQQSVDRRFKYHTLPYQLTVITTICGSLFELYTKEQELLKQNKNIQYIPQVWFSGYTECFSEQVSVD